MLDYKQILITGGNGFVGSHFVASLKDATKGHASIILGSRTPGEGEVLLDLADPRTIEHAVKAVRPDLVVHLAGEASVSTAANFAAETWRLNVVGTLALAEAIAQHAPESRILFASSAEIYGAAFLTGPVDEDTAPMPQSTYGRSKLAAEFALADTLSATNDLTIVRPTNHVGPGQQERFALASFAAQLVDSETRGEQAALKVGNLDAERDFMDVRDVVWAYMMLLERPKEPGRRETLNLSSGQVQSVRALLDGMRAGVAVDSDVTVDPARYRVAEIPRASVVSDRIRKAIGWHPTVPIDTTLRDILEDRRLRAPRKP